MWGNRKRINYTNYQEFSKFSTCFYSRAVQFDFAEAQEVFPDDQELTLVSELLQLSHDALARSPGQLGVQIKARMEKPQVRQQAMCTVQI